MCLISLLFAISSLGVAVQKWGNTLCCCGLICKDLGAFQAGKELSSSVEGRNSCVLSHLTVVDAEKDVFMLGQTKRKYFWKEKTPYKHVPEAEAGMGWITLGKWAQKLEYQNFFFVNPRADCNTSKRQQSTGVKSTACVV